MASQKKQQAVETISNILKDGEHWAIVKFGETSHASLEKLRKDLKSNDAKFRVVKNSLFQRALQNLSKKESEKIEKELFPLRENSAILSLGKDYLKGLKTFFNFAKTEKSLSFKFALLESKLYLNEELEKIAQLPGYEELIAKIIGSLKSPSSKLVYNLQFSISKLVHVLNERSKQRG